MKNLLFLLAAVFSLHASAQLQREVSFDFTQESTWKSLVANYPGKPASTSDFASVSTFQNGLLTFNFSKGAIRYNTDANQFCLTILQGGEMTISVSGNAVLNKIEFLTALVSDLSLGTGQSGTYNSSSHVWTSTGSVSSVKFKNFTNSSYVWTMKVTYTEPSVVLYGYASPTGNVYSFSEMTITYPNAKGTLSALNSTGISIKGNYDDSSRGTVNMSLTPAISGNQVKLTLPSPIVNDGSFTVFVPERAFRDSEGYETESVTATITVRENRATFNVSSITPADNSELSAVTSPILLTFETNVGHVDSDKRFRLFREGVSEPLAQLKAELGDDAKQVKLTFVNSASNSFTESGVYKLIVDEKTIYNHNYGDDIYERYNPAFTITYVIPVQEPSQMMKEAQAILDNQAYKGVGYPKSGAGTTRQALQDLLNATAAPSNAEADAALKEAIGKFYNDTNIELPASGKYYQIIAVNSNGSKKSYLSYESANGKVVLTNNASKATRFAAETDGSSIYFKTPDGKYLHVLTNTNYTITTSNNVTDEKVDGISNLTLAKLSIENTDSTKTFGRMTIAGKLGRNASDVFVPAVAAINHSTQGILDITTDIYFTETNSSAFILEEVAAPNAVTPSATLIGTALTADTQTMTLTIGNVTKATLKANAAPYFTTANGVKVTTATATAILTPVNGSNNQFTVHADGLADGTYMLVLPAGTFEYVNDSPVNDVELTTTNFTIQTPTNFNYDFRDFSVYPPTITNNYVTDVSLNNFVLYSAYGIFPDPSKTVRLAYFDNNTVTLRTGHFESYTKEKFFAEHPDVKAEHPELATYPNLNAIKVVWDTSIHEGDLIAGHYAIVAEGATFGDSNFSQWVKNHDSISTSQCHVNTNNWYYDYRVDNAKAATAINGISADVEPGTQRIYDLNGRRVAEPVKGGIYIINGRKVLVK